MSQQVFPAVIAIGAGAVLALLLFVPFVAVSVRKHGRLSTRHTLFSGAALVYFLAIWTYTLLPLPDPAELMCSSTNLIPFAFVDDVKMAAGTGNPLTSVELLQVVFNVLLFMPMGWFIRSFFNRGVWTSLCAGLATSAFIEFTQLTGVWGIYPCAYRVFDVDDLMANTLGALLGSFIAMFFFGTVRRATQRANSAKPEDVNAPRAVTRRRRILAAICDLIASQTVALVVGVCIQLFLHYVLRDHTAVTEGTIAQWAGSATVLVVWASTVLVSGSSVGDMAVQLTFRGGPLPTPIARLARFLGGVGGYTLLNLLPSSLPSSLLVSAFVLLSLVLLFTTHNGRGLPGILSGQEVKDRRS